MDRKKLIEYIIIALLVVALAALIWFLLRKDKETVEPAPNDPSIVRQMPRADQVFTAEQLAAGKQGPEVAARIFAERFGSYSNQSNYGNITDVLTMVTPELRAELEALRAEAQTGIPETYYGVNTRIVSIADPVVTETGTTFSINTQREEANGTPGNTSVRYQELTLTLQEINGAWLIADYAWAD